MNTRQLLLGMMFSAGLLLGGSSLLAQPAAPKADSPIVAATKQLADANTALNAAKVANDAARLKVIATYKTTNPDYAKAEEDVTKAKAELEAARLAAQGAVRNKPEYKAAIAAKAAAQEKLRALAGDSSDASEAAMKQFTTQVSLLNRLDSQALDDKKYQDANVKYLEAQKALEAYKPQVDAACLADQDYQTVNQAYVTAQQAVVAAQDNLKQVRKSESDARAAAAKSRSTTTAPPAGPKPKN